MPRPTPLMIRIFSGAVILLGFLGLALLGAPGIYFLLLYATREGLAWIISVILVVVATDVAALLAGMRFGRHPFLPAISPKKTVEGAVGGLAGATLVMLLLGVGLLGIPPWHAAVLGLLIGLMAELGDLVESQMKRLAEVKDSSNLIPGHGGVLDRLDSVLFPPIVVFLYASFFHLL